jgi:hypothetical protein
MPKLVMMFMTLLPTAASAFWVGRHRAQAAVNQLLVTHHRHLAQGSATVLDGPPPAPPRRGRPARRHRRHRPVPYQAGGRSGRAMGRPATHHRPRYSSTRRRGTDLCRNQPPSAVSPIPAHLATMLFHVLLTRAKHLQPSGIDACAGRPRRPVADGVQAAIASGVTQIVRSSRRRRAAS